VYNVTDESGMTKTSSKNKQNGPWHDWCFYISQIQNSQIFEFADIDRDGFIDMLFLTDKKTMNFIVAYNMLKGTNDYASTQKAQTNVYLN
jgi:hypothetical protein